MKRLLDFVLVVLALPLWLPVLITLTLVNTLVHGWPPWFVQDRGGLNGRIIRIYKLRTMTNAVDQNGVLLSDHERMTKFGRLLRNLSLDEFPSFLNLLKGDISLVGPRPLLAEYLGLYSAEQARRHNVRPGLTGWAQVNGRNALSWEEKFRFDVWYVDNCSFWLDIKILFLTARKVFLRDGINAEGEATMSKFTGKKP
tara:strand:+ start:321 stop:914 length:594 start_codon:yes stop_codon:yes gene_type:complete